MDVKKDIENRDDIQLLVESFYSKVVNDNVIGEIFRDTLVFKWDTHIPVMVDFWETVLLEGPGYRGNAMRVHIELDKRHPLTDRHFARWRKLFFETIDENFEGINASEARKRALLMEKLIQSKIKQSRDTNFIQ